MMADNRRSILASVLAGVAALACMPRPARAAAPAGGGSSRTESARIQELEDQQTLRTLTHRYSSLAYKGDAEGVAGLFTEDGVFMSNVHDMEVWSRSRAEILGRFKETLVPSGSLSMVHNHIYTITGDTASGTCLMETPWAHGFPNGFIGAYEDSFRRIGGKWYFQQRTYQRLSPPPSLNP
jgi:SnoaL-like domain